MNSVLPTFMPLKFPVSLVSRIFSLTAHESVCSRSLPIGTCVLDLDKQIKTKLRSICPSDWRGKGSSAPCLFIMWATVWLPVWNMTPFWPVAPQTVTATGNGKSNGKISENVRSFTKWSSAKAQVTRLPITSHHITSKQTPNPELQSVAESNQEAHMLP